MCKYNYASVFAQEQGLPIGEFSLLSEESYGETNIHK
jgi:hypothetical protein